MRDILIFDYDGVFVDSMAVVLDIYNNLCLENDLEELAGEKNFKNMFDDNFFKSMANFGVSEQKIKTCIDGFEKNILSRRNEIKLFIGIKPMLNKLSKKYKIIIVTSSSSSVIIDFLKVNDIKHIDDVIGVEKEKSKVKKILSIKTNYSTSEIYYIGDTKGDMIEGKKAGALTIATTWGYHSKKRLKTANPDYIVDSPIELTNFLI